MEPSVVRDWFDQIGIHGFMQHYAFVAAIVGLVGSLIVLYFAFGVKLMFQVFVLGSLRLGSYGYLVWTGVNLVQEKLTVGRGLGHIAIFFVIDRLLGQLQYRSMTVIRPSSYCGHRQLLVDKHFRPLVNRNARDDVALYEAFGRRTIHSNHQWDLERLRREQPAAAAYFAEKLRETGDQGFRPTD